jgi:hypothetical protein
LLRSPQARRSHDAAAVTIPPLTFNVLQSCTPRVGPYAVDVAQVAAAAMAVIAEAYDTAAVQTAARGAVRSPSAMPRLPYRCYGTRRARRGALSVATGNVRVYFTALSFSRRVVVTLKQWPLPCEARQMVINLRGRSADASRIVWARLPICAAIVTQFVTHFWCDVVTRSKSCGNRWSSDPTPSDAPCAVIDGWRGAW